MVRYCKKNRLMVEETFVCINCTFFIHQKQPNKIMKKCDYENWMPGLIQSNIHKKSIMEE